MSLFVIKRGPPSANGRRPIIWSSKQKAYIKKCYEAGESLRKIAVAFKLQTYSALTLLLEKEGWLRKKINSSSKFRELLIKNWNYVVKLYNKPRHSAYMVMELLIKKWQLPPNKKYGTILASMLKSKGLHRVTTRDTLRSDEAFLKLRRDKIMANLSISVYKSYQHYLRVARRITAVIRSFYWKQLGFIKSTKLCVDHVFSIASAYQREVPLSMKLLCHPVNLQQLTHRKNASKMNKCDITLPELKRRVKQYNKKYGDPFLLENH